MLEETFIWVKDYEIAIALISDGYKAEHLYTDLDNPERPFFGEPTGWLFPYSIDITKVITDYRIGLIGPRARRHYHLVKESAELAKEFEESELA